MALTPRLTWCSEPAAAMTAVTAATASVIGSSAIGIGSSRHSSEMKCSAQMPRPTTIEPVMSHASRARPCEARTRQAESRIAYDSAKAMANISTMSSMPWSPAPWRCCPTWTMSCRDLPSPFPQGPLRAARRPAWTRRGADRTRGWRSAFTRIDSPRRENAGRRASERARSAMGTVRESVYELLRSRGMTTIFGNPGSTELPFLADFPSDFTYVLGLQETVAVGMADGFAQAGGLPALVNLHTAPGVGNGMGAIFNAQANHTPLVVTAGQQVRAHITMQANLTNRDATRVVHPFVKWSFEPPRAADVPNALARAIHTASLAPRGPAFVSLPMDDWNAEAEEASRAAVERSAQPRSGPDPDAIKALAMRLDGASNPVLVAGPDIDASGGWDDAVALAERQKLPVFASPAPGGGRLGFPEGHPLFQGVLPPAIGPAAETLKGRDLILVIGSSVFPYYPYIPGPLLPEGASLVAITSDPDEAARAPMGDVILADPALALRALLAEVGEANRSEPAPLPEPSGGDESDPMTPTMVHNTLSQVFPDDGIVVLESPSSTLALRNQLRISNPGSYYFGAGGGLGFGLAAAIGVQLAQPDRPVVCVLGEGSAQYAITGFWTAAAYDVPVTFLVLRNEEYAILKWFADVEEVAGAPGLDLPALDVSAVAAGYGVASTRVADREELHSALGEAIDSSQPELVEVPVPPGMALF